MLLTKPRRCEADGVSTAWVAEGNAWALSACVDLMISENGAHGPGSMSPQWGSRACLQESRGWWSVSAAGGPGKSAPRHHQMLGWVSNIWHSAHACKHSGLTPDALC